jgi:hypothetical protein
VEDAATDGGFDATGVLLHAAKTKAATMAAA